MKYLFTLIAIVCFSSLSIAQDDKPEWPPIDKSVMDRIYYPRSVAFRNYLSEDERNMQAQIRLDYSRPMKNGRDIFGSLIPYGEEWRLGANEATEITFYNAVGIAGGTVPRGVYSMSALINENDWVINFSTERNIWGNANRDVSKTVASVKVLSEKAPSAQEALSMTFREIDDHTTHLVIQWDDTRVSVPIELNPVVFSNADASPMDMVHYPDNSRFSNYLDADQKASAAPKIQISYSRPSKKGREVFGGLLNEGEVWRIGANEATEIVLHQNVKVGTTEVSRGRYAMFAELASADSWNIILSTDLPIWGAANRDESKDVATIKVAVTQDTEVVEALSLKFEEQSTNQVNLVIAWDKTRATVPISFL